MRSPISLNLTERPAIPDDHELDSEMEHEPIVQRKRLTMRSVISISVAWIITVLLLAVNFALTKLWISLGWLGTMSEGDPGDYSGMMWAVLTEEFKALCVLLIIGGLVWTCTPITWRMLVGSWYVAAASFCMMLAILFISGFIFYPLFWLLVYGIWNPEAFDFN
jgi:hypothetical protein